MSKNIRYNRFAIPIRADKDSDIISVIIMADEPAKGMRQSGPKSLLSYQKDNILNQQISVLLEAIPEAEIIVAVGFEANKIISLKTKTFKIVENIDFETTNSIETLRLCINNISNEKVLIIGGDVIPTVSDVLSIIKQSKQNVILFNNVWSNNNIGLIQNNNILTNFSYGLENKWSNIWYITGNQLIEIRKFVNNSKNKKSLLHHGIEYLLSRNYIIQTIFSNNTIKIERGLQDENISAE